MRLDGLVAAPAVGCAVEACQPFGQPYAVLSTIDGDEPVLLRTFDRVQNAKPFRTQYGRKRGLGWTALHGLVPVLGGAGAYV